MSKTEQTRMTLPVVVGGCFGLFPRSLRFGPWAKDAREGERTAGVPIVGCPLISESEAFLSYPCPPLFLD